jgi:arabinosyltransferase
MVQHSMAAASTLVITFLVALYASSTFFNTDSLHIMKQHSRPGHLRLERFLKRVAKAREVMFTWGDNRTITADDAMVGTLPLWAESVKRAGVKNAFIAAFDEATATWAHQNSMHAILLEKPSECGECTNWVAAAKLDFLRDVIALRYDVFWSDADVLYFENPFNHLNRAYDVNAQSEGWQHHGMRWDGNVAGDPDDPIVHFYQLPQLNFGVGYAHSTPRIAKTFSLLAKVIRKQRVWDQAAYSDSMMLPATSQNPSRGLHSVFLLDPAIFPTTCQIKWMYNGTYQGHFQPISLHFNCNRPKVEAMTQVWQAFLRNETDFLSHVFIS